MNQPVKTPQMRLDKFLSEMSAASRSEAKQLVRRGDILVNGVRVKSADVKINPETDEVMCRGSRIAFASMEYYMLNKPAGVLSAANDKRAVTVVDLIEGRLRKDLFPVGRLDKDTEGLLLITNDGALAHELLSPKKHVDKTYYVELDKPVSGADVQRLEQGVDIGDEKPTLPCRIVNSTEQMQEKPALYLDGAHLLITIREGRFHQIKRMFETCGSTVTYLKRLSMGSLKLDETLKPGEYRALTESELAALKNHCHSDVIIRQ